MSLTPLAKSLLATLMYLSRFRACTASTKVLAERLGTSGRTIARLLSELEGAGRILRVTTPYSPRLRARRRTTYLVTQMDEEEGALRLAREARANGKVTRRSVDVLCGWLGCTPLQLEAFVARAKQKGWVEVERLEGALQLRRTDTCPYFARRYWVEHQPRTELHLPEPKRSTLGDRVCAHFASPWHQMNSNQQVAAAIGSTAGAVRVTIGRMVKTKRLFTAPDQEGRRLISTRPLLDRSPVAADLERMAVQAALAVAPLEESDLKSRLDMPGGQASALLSRGRRDGWLHTVDVAGCTYFSSPPLNDIAVARLRRKHAMRDAGQPDPEAVHLALQRLAYEAGFGGIEDSPHEAVRAVRRPFADDDDLREAMAAVPEGASPVDHCAQVVFRVWRERNRQALGMHLQETKGVEALQQETRALLSATGVNEKEVDWFLIAHGLWKADNFPDIAAGIIADKLKNAALAEAERACG